MGRGGAAQGIKAAGAGAQAGFGVVLGLVLLPESPHPTKAAATSLSIKRLSVQCFSRRGPPPAPPPCPTSLATGRSSDRKTSRSCSKCWVRCGSAREKGGDAQVLRGGDEKGRGAGSRAWRAGRPYPQGRKPPTWGRGTSILASPEGRPAAAVTEPVNQGETRSPRWVPLGVGPGGSPQFRSCKPCVQAGNLGPSPTEPLEDIPACFRGPRR